MSSSWIMATSMVLISIGTAAFGAVNESFDDFTSGSYGSYSVRDFAITLGLGESDSSRQISGRGVRLRNQSGSTLELVGSDGNGKDGGVGNISFDWREWDGNPALSYNVEVSVNGGGYTSIGTIDATGSAPSSSAGSVQSFSHDLNNASDNIKIRVQYVTGERLIIDNFVVTDFAAGDTTPPTVTSVTRLTPAAQDTNANTVTYRVTFDENIDDSTLAISDFTVTTVLGSNTGVSVASIATGTANDDVVDVIVNTGAGDKTLRLDLLPAATIEDIAGNDYAATFNTGETYIVDKTAPAVSDPDLTTDSGSSSTDDITNDNTPTFAGTAETGATVEILADGFPVGSAVAAGGTYSITTSTITDGVKSVTARATDASGNETVSGALSVTIDTVAPVSSATALADPTIVGTSVAVDFTASDAGSGLDSTSLFAKAPSDGAFNDTTLVPVGTSFDFTAAESGLHEFHTVATDAAGNVEAAPVGADVSVAVNTVENGAYTAAVATGASVTVVLPMEDGLDVVIEFTNVTVSGTITGQRNETDSAPTGITADRLVDQWLAFTAGGGLTFDSATVTVGYDPALLGGLLDTEIDRVFRDNAGVVSEITTLTVDNTLETIEFTTPGFSDFYFGNNNADVDGWITLDEQ